MFKQGEEVLKSHMARSFSVNSFGSEDDQEDGLSNSPKKPEDYALLTRSQKRNLRRKKNKSKVRFGERKEKEESHYLPFETEPLRNSYSDESSLSSSEE